MKFRQGDRVKAIEKYGSASIKGECGIILGVDGEHCVVEFDNNIGGHTGTYRFKGKNGHCWQLKEWMIELIKPLNQFSTHIGDKFKGKRASVIQNGNTFKLTKSDGKVLYTYIPEKGISRIVTTSDKTEKMYIELFEQAIEEFNKTKE